MDRSYSRMDSFPSLMHARVPLTPDRPDVSALSQMSHQHTMHGCLEEPQDWKISQQGPFAHENSLLNQAIPGSTASQSPPNCPAAKQSSTRFTMSTLKILKSWYRSHSESPFPSEKDKHCLAEQTGLSVRQISNWFANARRRTKDNVPKSLDSSPNSATSDPILVSCPPSRQAWESMTPLDRWRHSPPEKEAAPLSAIAGAIASLGDAEPYNIGLDPGVGGFHNQVPSVGSLELSDSGWSGHSSDSVYSSNSNCSFNFLETMRKSRRQRRPRHSAPRRRVSGKALRENSDKRIYQCTFCTDTFKTKYDWTRHEASLHLPLERWTCASSFPVYVDSEGRTRCIFCDAVEPSEEHIQSHGYEECSAKPLASRSFHRKDHLRQHLRLMHNCTDVTTAMVAWKSKTDQINCRCGFCGERFTSWSTRNEHIADHFREGIHIKDWKGCRGFDPPIALLVENAMSPYLIGIESQEFEPFSASRAANPSEKLSSATAQNPTRFESLTAQLGGYVASMQSSGKVVTDDLLRSQARIIMFGEDDPWNQTPADNAQWLELFKKGHGIDAGPTSMSQSSDALQSASLIQRLPSLVGEDALSALQLFGVEDDSQANIPWTLRNPEFLAEIRELAASASSFTQEPLSPMTNLSHSLPAPLHLLSSAGDFSSINMYGDAGAFLATARPQSTGNGDIFGLAQGYEPTQ